MSKPPSQPGSRPPPSRGRRATVALLGLAVGTLGILLLLGALYARGPALWIVAEAVWRGAVPVVHLVGHALWAGAWLFPGGALATLGSVTTSHALEGGGHYRLTRCLDAAVCAAASVWILGSIAAVFVGLPLWLVTGALSHLGAPGELLARLAVGLAAVALTLGIGPVLVAYGALMVDIARELRE